MHLSILPTARISILFLNLKMMFSFFKVRDEGNGIELQKIDMLFKRFETLGYTDPNFFKRIGLSLVKELVDMLHGSIMVDSKLGQGVCSLFLCQEAMKFSNQTRMWNSF